MAGLLDFLNTPEAMDGIGLLAAAGPRATPASFFERLQGGLLGNADRRNAIEDRAFTKRFKEAQMGEIDAQAAQRRAQAAKEQAVAAQAQQLRGLQSQFFTQGTPGRSGTEQVDAALANFGIGAQPAIPAQPGKFDVDGYTSAALQRGLLDPMAAIKMREEMGKNSQLNKVDPKDFTPASLAKFAQTRNYGDLERLEKLHFADMGGTVAGLNPFTAQPVGSAPKTGDPFKDLVLGGPDGMRPNAPLIGAKQAIAKAGASNTNISVNTEKSLMNEMAQGLGKSMTDARVSAQGAVSTISTLGRLNDALDSNKVMGRPRLELPAVRPADRQHAGRERQGCAGTPDEHAPGHSVARAVGNGLGSAT